MFFKAGQELERHSVPRQTAATSELRGVKKQSRREKKEEEEKLKVEESIGGMGRKCVPAR